ncbi:MAG TPA: glutathione S-transferase family protein [Steroidobacteraceae bacterium]|nr:glutathione S-transferase family protein [Steroidobacteraceae bacterium]
MAIDVYWGSGSVYSWRVLLALEYKRLPYASHLLQFSKQEHKSPQILGLNFRGRVPIVKDGDYVVFESLAVLYYLDLKYPEPPIFGRSPQEAGVIMRVICEYQAYTEEHLMKLVRAFFFPAQPALQADELASAMHVVASEARSIEARLARSDWVVGESFSAADIVIYPALKVLLRALAKPAARELSTRFLPLAANYPALERWSKRVEALPGYDRTYPPHWR